MPIPRLRKPALLLEQFTWVSLAHLGLSESHSTSGMEAMTGVGEGTDLPARVALKGGEYGVGDPEGSGNRLG